MTTQKKKQSSPVNHWDGRACMAFGSTGEALAVQGALLKALRDFPREISVSSVTAALASTLELVSRDPRVLESNS